jgi:two-component system chemotaxis sensor kinase CheA
MSLTASSFALLDDLASRLAGESIFAKAGTDEGLIPSYSLLTDMLAQVDGDSRLGAPLRALRSRLDALLDGARPWDDEAEKHLRETVAWLPGALLAERDGAAPARDSGADSWSSRPPGAAAEAAPPPAAKPETEADELLVLDLEENRELLGEFQVEALDHLQQIEAALLVLDAAPGDRDALNGLFRSFHTLKGVSGFLHLGPMHRLAHEVESLLDLARTDRLRLTPPIITEILRSRDAIQEMTAQITLALERDKMPDRVVPVGHLIGAVRRLATAEEAPCASAAGPATAPAAPLSSAEPAAACSRAGAGALASSVRVNTEKLDSLVDVVGELVIVQSQLQESARRPEDGGAALTRNLAQLGRITKELQLTAMSLRMVPIKPTFQRMERLVRDLSREFGKPCLFETRGEETEIDRTVVEEIVDPLVHMVRNSLDHGLETPEARTAAGKPEQGRLRLAAGHEGSNLVIELADDGRGIDRARVLAKARGLGLVPEGVTPDADEICALIFLPGFSTADKVTAVSGRGVGMDVVKRNIERLRGQIQIESEPGRGTTFRIRLPLTTAIIDGLLVRVGEERFILPAITVQVALRPAREALATVQGRGEVLDHRGKILPLHRLHRIFDVAGGVEDPAAAIVVIVEVGRRSYALLVDELLNKQEVVIKNLGAYLQGRPGVAGGAILGDGSIALILDPASLCGG